ncbi:MAG: hypothetical protein LAO19_12905 [Acidobacteriia bacterium]|nr:hypothetical protein [Terriglobia bacterium]
MDETSVRILAGGLCGLVMLGSPLPDLSTQQPALRRAPLVITNRVPLPGVVGRLDRFTIDNKHRRVIVAGLRNNTIEVVGRFTLGDIHHLTVESLATFRQHSGCSARLRSKEPTCAANQRGSTRVEVPVCDLVGARKKGLLVTARHGHGSTHPDALPESFVILVAGNYEVRRLH